MALFKINRGNRTNLPSAMTDGWAYFCADTAEFFIDYADADGILHRKQINADEANKLTGYDISTALNNSEVEIPTSSAVFAALADLGDNLAGKIVAGQTFTINASGETAVAKDGAEIFNDYRDRRYRRGSAYSGNIATGSYSHAEGSVTGAYGSNAHAEGSHTVASGNASHAEGANTVASGTFSHAEGVDSVASGAGAHAEGEDAIAAGACSHAEGLFTIATSDHQHAQGRYNIEDADGRYAHIIGNGSSEARSNIHTIDWSGNAWLAGDVYVGGTSQDDAEKLAKSLDVEQKSKVQVVTSDETRHLPILTIHRLTQEEYDNLVKNGEIDENAIYLTPDEEQPSIDLSGYATIEQLDSKADAEHNHDEQYYAKSEVDEMLTKKVEISSLSDYYTKSEIDDYEFITIEDIDNICKTTINIQMVGGNEVKF